MTQPDEAVVAKLQRIVQRLREAKYTYPALAAAISGASGVTVRENALRAFAMREPTRPTAGNVTFSAVLAYVREAETLLPAAICEELGDDLAELRSMLPENAAYTNDRALAREFTEWVNFSRDHRLRVQKKYSGNYIVYRKSMRDPSEIIASSLKIDFDRSESILFATHKHTDIRRRDRISTGVVAIVPNNVNILLNIEQGAGFETLTLRDPIQGNFGMLMGFMTSINIDRVLFSARVAVVPETGRYSLPHARYRIASGGEAQDMPIVPDIFINNILPILNNDTANVIRSEFDK